MGKKTHRQMSEERKVDLRRVYVSEETDTRIAEYVLLQKRNKRRVKKGEAAVELIEKGLKAEGIA